MKLSLWHDPRIQILRQHLGEPVEGGHEELCFCSPFQRHFKDPGKADRKHHLYVNPCKGKFFCYKSNLHGSISHLFYLLGLTGCPAPIEVPPIEELRERLKNLDKLKTFVLPVATLPDWYTPVRRGSKVHKYLMGRGITDEDITEYRLGEGVLEGDHKVVIPSFAPSGVCEYWLARSIRADAVIRYKNPPVKRRYHVGFLHNAIRYSPDSVVLCEGVFSAMVAGRDAVATYGKFVSSDQLQRLLRVGVRHVRIALDGDAHIEALQLAEKATRLGLEATVVPLPLDQDPADLGRSAFRALLEKASPTNELSLLRLRLQRVRV